MRGVAAAGTLVGVSVERERSDAELGLATVPAVLVLHPRVLARMRAAEAEARALVRPELAESLDREAAAVVLGQGVAGPRG